MGGDEFVVALLGVRPEHVVLTTERLLAGMRPTFSVHDRAVRVGLSVGVATTDDPVPGPDDGASGLLHRADVAMFAAKQAGRFRAMHWDAAMEARALRRVDIAIGLRRALDGRRLALAYQPLVRLSDGAVIGAEALVRISADDRGPGALAGLPDLVTPAELVAVAEDTGEIVELGQWVLAQATAQAARWRAGGHDVFVTVNVSVRQMEGEGFVASVAAALEAAELPAGSLIVEITEGQLLSEADPAWRTAEQLRDLGVVLVIDDFGSGYSSLSYLRRLPVRGVKLDRALLDDLTTDPRARTLARAVVAAARALGLLVVAEGLESLEAARVVRDLGAYAGQGFALCQAVPADDVARLLAGPPINLGGHRNAVPPRRRAESLTGPIALPPAGGATGPRPSGAVPVGPPTPRSIDLSETASPQPARADLT
jgi:EAL domain-containing protein (putative c-di-GMP-specific phosphodiesterase class I)